MSGLLVVIAFVVQCLLCTVFTASLGLTEQPFAQCRLECERGYNALWSKALHSSAVDNKNADGAPVKSTNLCRNITSYIDCYKNCKAETPDDVALQSHFLRNVSDYEKICSTVGGKQPLECLTDAAHASMNAKCSQNEEDFLKMVKQKKSNEIDSVKPICRIASSYVACLVESMTEHCDYEEAKHLGKVFLKTIEDVIRGSNSNNENANEDPTCATFYRDHEAEVENMLRSVFKTGYPTTNEANKIGGPSSNAKMHPKDGRKESAESHLHDTDGDDSASSAVSTNSFIISVAVSVLLALLFHQ